MKLLHCHIENFGKLQDVDLDFRSGLHTVLEENGWGKSALAGFLLAMFYGFNKTRKADLRENDRQRYLPWQGGTFGGSVTFSQGTRIYRIERVFQANQTQQGDRLTVYDAETNLPIADYPDNPGEALFGIDKTSFQKTAFIGQQDLDTEATAGIQAKIGHVEGVEADMNAYRQVEGKFAEEMRALRYGKARGRINELTQQIAMLETDLARRDLCEARLQQSEGHLRELLRHREVWQEQQKQRAEQEQQLSLFRQTAEDFSLSDAERIRLQTLEAVFRTDLPDETDLEEAEACYQQIRRLQLQYDRWQDEPDGDRSADQPKRKGTSWIAVLVFALFVSALMAFFLNKWIALALLAAAIAAMVLTLRHDSLTDDADVPETVVQKQQFSFWRRESVLQQQERLTTLRQEIRETEGELYAFLRQYYPELTEADDAGRKLQQLQQDCADYLTLTEKEERAQAAREEYRQGAAELGQEERLFFETDLLGEEDTDPERQIEQTRREIEEEKEQLDQLAEKEEQLQVLQEELKKRERQYLVLEQTQAYLSQARAAFTARYLEPVKSSFDIYYHILTGEEAGAYQMDADLQISLRSQGVRHAVETLSEGYRDLVGLCRRMAMIDAMYEQERPFLLLDDPFVNLDEEKTKRALDFLVQIAARYQVLYLTCHESRVPSR